VRSCPHCGGNSSMIPRDLQLVADVAADGDPRDGENRKGLDHLICGRKSQAGYAGRTPRQDVPQLFAYAV
jgi:hypothetical protein